MNNAQSGILESTPPVARYLIFALTDQGEDCFLVGKRVVVLHAFIKKLQQTPDRELKLARKRMKEVSDA